MFHSTLLGSAEQDGQQPLLIIKLLDMRNPVSRNFCHIIQKKFLLTSFTQEKKTCNDKLEVTSSA